MAKPSKAFKKFASSGKLKETIQKRRSTQQARRKFEDRVAQRKKQRGSAKDEGLDEDDDEEDSEDERSDKALGFGGRAGGVGKEVDDLLKIDLRLAGPESEGEGSEDEEDLEDDEDELDEDDEEGIDDDEKDLEMDEAAMKKAMKQLEKNDPEFFKYLKENDQDLLEFGDKPASDGDVDMDGEEEEEDEEEEEEDGDENMDEDEEEQRAKTPVTRKMLREWQEGMLRLHSIRSLRKTLLAFRAAAHMNEEDANEGEGSSTKYTINSPQVFNKLVVTALKFTPVVMAHHIPYKTLPNGRIKVSQPKNVNPRLPKYLLSHFSTILHFIRSLPATSTSPSDDATEGGLLVLAIQESTKLLPWVLSARKHMRAYLKVLLELWSGAPNDGVRIAAFLAVRRVFEGGDEAMRDQCLKQTYRALLPPLRNTTPHTLPSINLLKNTASELFLLSPSQSYTHAFTAIRMLAMHLRDVIRSTTLQSSSSGAASAAGAGAGEGKKDKEKGDKADAFRRVYNWQYVHCVDFWGRVLGGAAVREREGHVSGQEKKGEGEGLGMLVYPFVQVALGVVRLLPSPRYFPLHFHILSTLQTLCAQSGTYIPLSPYLLDILSSSEFRPTSIPRKSTLKPLDLEYVIRAPATYPRTRIYQETIADELIYLLASYHSELVSSIAFPEISLPVILAIKKHLKRAATGGKGKGMSAKVQQGLKGLVDKLEAQKKWSEEKRRSVGFAPRDRAEVGRWEVKVKEEQEKTPLGMWVRTMRKVRDRKREEVEKALRGEE